MTFSKSEIRTINFKRFVEENIAFHFFRMTEYVDHLHEHMKSPCVVEHGNYKPPMVS